MAQAFSGGFRRLADAVRALPLCVVAPHPGYRPGPSDRSRWLRDGSVPGVTGTKFHDHLQGRGGGGATDPVVHARGCGPAEAVGWLAGFSPSAAALSAEVPVTAPAERFVPPRPCGGLWPQVRGWLAGTRGPDGRLVDGLHRRGLVFADARRNAVFPFRSAGGAVTGAEPVGTLRRPDGSRFRGLARGSRRVAGGFWIRDGDGSALSGVFIRGSAADALSALSPGIARGQPVFASAAGVRRRLPPWIEGFAPARPVCGFDADAAGDDAARALAAPDRRIIRIRPPEGDWNDIPGGRRKTGDTPP